MQNTPSFIKASSRGIRRLLSEPLMQFMLLGVIIFITDSYATRNLDDPNKIMIEDKKITELIRIFEEGQGRSPSVSEIDNLIVTWTQNEILFREGQLLKLHEGDEMIRSRLILKMRSILLNKIVSQQPSEEQLAQWFADNRQFYNAQGTVTLELLTKDFTGETAAIEAARQLNNHELSIGQKSSETPREGSASATGSALTTRKYHDRPENTLTALLDVPSTTKILGLKNNLWLAVQTPGKAWRVGRLTDRSEAEDITFEQAKMQVLRDWLKVSREKQLANQTRAIIDQYDIVIKPSDELLEKYQIGGKPEPSFSATKANQHMKIQEG